MKPYTRAEKAGLIAQARERLRIRRRDEFAARAMQGLLSSHGLPSGLQLRTIAELAYAQADAMEAARAAPIAAPCPDCGQPLAQCECEEG